MWTVKAQSDVGFHFSPLYSLIADKSMKKKAKFQKYRNNTYKYSERQVWANSLDPDQTQYLI